MPSPSFRTKTAVLLLAATLAFPLAASAGLRSSRAQEGSASILLDLVGRAWSFLMGSRDKEGCYIDPSGRCAPRAPLPPPPTIQTDSGCYIDPNGGCRS